jgi:chromosome segregation ATPase
MLKPVVGLTVFCLALTLSGCYKSEYERVKHENDSLRNVLKTNHEVVATLHDVRSLLDSIDISRHALRTELSKGTTYGDVSTRLQSINQFVKRSEEKITVLEQKLKSTESDASAYVMMIDALKGELEFRSAEIESLQKTVTKYKEENKGLVNTVKLQESEMADMYSQIETKQQELLLLEAKVDELVEKFQVSEAEAYYTRAKAVEEAARRTKLAPHKKRETYREALELYKKSYSLGKEEANTEIAALEKKLN